MLHPLTRLPLLPLLAAFTLAASVSLASAADAELRLPDPLRFSDGRRVNGASDWAERRAEIIQLYERHVYGRAPRPLPGVKPVAEVRSEKRDALGGLAVRREIRVYLLGDKGGPWVDVLVYIPAAREPVPVFVGLNYLGNQSVTSEPDITITRAWIRHFDGVTGVVANAATERSRAEQARRWPLELILRRGYAVATACYAEIEPDNKDAWKTNPLRHALGQRPDAVERAPEEWGAIGVWAFGLGRILDVLTQIPELDARRVALTGHSRLGKTALWAGALDPRFALVISNNSGEGGASLARRKQGERIADSVRSNAFWYCPRYRDYVDREEQLPVDAHWLIGLIAPRPVYVWSATLDTGADPEGEFLAAKHAGAVYALFGHRGVGRETPPPPDERVGDRVGYHVRTGSHDILEADWKHHLDFADTFFKTP